MRLILAVFILGVCGAVAVAAWATQSGWPLLGLLMLGGIKLEWGHCRRCAALDKAAQQQMAPPA